MEIRDRQDCEANIRRITELLSCKIFERENSSHLLQSSAFIELMICLRDLLHKAEKHGARVSFTDDVLINRYVRDVSDLVTAVRDACCHIDSFKRDFDSNGNRGSYLVAYGKCNVAKINELELKSEYQDDIAVFYGTNRIYFNRHIVRAFNEAKDVLTPLMKVN